jgi:hypothetical protein
VQAQADCDWTYLRKNLDSPVRLSASRLFSGLAAWIARGLPRAAEQPMRLAMIARIPLGPRQAVALIEAEGIHLLLATSADAAPSFFPLDSALHGGSTPAMATAGKKAEPGLGDWLVLPTVPGKGKRPIRPIRHAGLSGRVSW